MKINYDGPRPLSTATSGLMREFVEVCMLYRRLLAGNRANKMLIAEWRQEMTKVEITVRVVKRMLVNLYGDAGVDEMARELLPSDFVFPREEA